MRYTNPLALLAVVGIALLTVPAINRVFAQSVIQDNLSGNEAWSVGQGPGGPSAYVTSNLLRNSIAKVLNAASGTYGVGALLNLSEGGFVIYTTQPLAAVTLTLPPSPTTDGALAGFCNASPTNFATTAIAFATNIGQSLTAVSITTLTATSCVELVFDRTTLTWLRTR